jgi:hypothetical protein
MIKVEHRRKESPMRSFACLMILFLSLATAVASPQEEARPMLDSRIREAIELMTGFAERTGLSSERPQQRYLWTDAFAVCNFLGLSRMTGGKRYTELALHLVDRVHHTLGRHRGDDSRTGWTSGLSEREGVSTIRPVAGFGSAKGSPSADPTRLSTSGWSGTAMVSTSTI